MRNGTLHGILETFTADAACQLAMETARGAEIPFEVIEERRGRVPLYCYRPLTGDFIRERLGVISALPSYAPAAGALTSLDGAENYLRQRGEARIPNEPRERADAALRSFLSSVFDERSQFEFDQTRFEDAYAELELALYEGRCVTTVIAPLLGLALEPESDEVPLGEGLSLVARGDAARRAGGRGLGRRRGAERAGGPDRQPGTVSATGGVARARALPSGADCAAAVRARRLCARAGRLDADRHRPMAARAARLEWPCRGSRRCCRRRTKTSSARSAT